MKKSTGEVSYLNKATWFGGKHTANALNDNVDHKANTTSKNERDDARHPSRLCPTSRHHRVVAWR